MSRPRNPSKIADLACELTNESFGIRLKAELMRGTFEIAESPPVDQYFIEGTMCLLIDGVPRKEIPFRIGHLACETGVHQVGNGKGGLEPKITLDQDRILPVSFLCAITNSRGLAKEFELTPDGVTHVARRLEIAAAKHGSYDELIPKELDLHGIDPRSLSEDTMRTMGFVQPINANAA